MSRLHPIRHLHLQAGVASLLLSDEGISLRSKWVHLENICVSPVVSRIDDDFEVVIQLLADIPPQLRGHDAGRLESKQVTPKKTAL